MIVCKLIVIHNGVLFNSVQKFHPQLATAVQVHECRWYYYRLIKLKHNLKAQYGHKIYNSPKMRLFNRIFIWLKMKTTATHVLVLYWFYLLYEVLKIMPLHYRSENELVISRSKLVMFTRWHCGLCLYYNNSLMILKWFCDALAGIAFPTNVSVWM